MRSMHHIPVDRSAGAGSLDHAVEWLRKGEVVGVFPEATISQSFEVKDFKTGAVRMAAEAAVPVVPMITFGGQRLWTKGHKREMTRGTLVALRVGQPFMVTPGTTRSKRPPTYVRVMQGLGRDARGVRTQTGGGRLVVAARLGGGALTLDEMRLREAQGESAPRGKD